MYKFKMMLLYNEEEPFCTRTELLNFNIILPLAKEHMVGRRSVPEGLTFSDDVSVDIQFINYLMLSKIRELSIGAKLKDSDNHIFSDISARLFFRSVSFFSASTCFFFI